MTAAMELLYLVAFLLLTRPGVTYGDDNKQRVVVVEGSDVVLPCSINDKELNYERFDWKKDGQKEVFTYDSGIHYNNGRGGQDPQFKGRVSHFEDELRNGNASIKISDTKWEDSGNYSCDFPRLQNQIFHIKLVVDRVLKKRNEPGAAPKPYVRTLDQTADRALLQCAVERASPKPTIEWKDSTGKVLHSVVTLKAEVDKRFDITLQTNVTQTGHFYCVVTQDEIGHQDYTETFVLIGAASKPYITTLDQTKSWSLLQCEVRGAFPKPTVEWRDSSGNIVPAKEPQVTERGGSYDIILQTTVTKTDHYRCVSTPEEINHQVHTETYVYISEQRLVVKEGSDVVLPCSINNKELNYQLFDWKKGQKEVFLYDAGIHYNNGRGGQDPQFKGRVSHFEDELRNGNASIKISDTTVKDSGDYSCIFPNLQNQIFHIKLIVGPMKVVVKEGSDVVLPCSLDQTDLTNQLFDWKKDRQEVFLYDAGIHSNNGRGGQDPQFKGRISHFQDDLQNGNASIKISDTKVEDSGDYSCIFPHLQNQIFHIELVVDPVLKKRNRKNT